MHTKDENKRLLQRIAYLEEELNSVQGRMKSLQSLILSNISHDIRTPMNAIVGFSNLLANVQMDSEERNECIDQINTNSTELLDMIDNMIDASLLQCGNIKLFKKEFCVNDLIDDLYENYKDIKSIREKRLRLIVSKGENNKFSIVTDYDRLMQVMKNLISNAIKFTNTGNIEFGYQRYKGNKIKFYVKDSGIGLGSMKHEDLFRPFNSKLTSEKGYVSKGVGLGLSVSKSLIDSMGGELWPESHGGKGACFYFTLPGKQSYIDNKFQHICALSKRNIASLF